ncbi:hypothetical protein [Actinotalea subterranea]|uniref:hypothetical protein n=1 Tax=Actinotalea subterranea TaxID=2607497 RepID=UPI0011EFBA5E|nr:hypothetical protein [Actinotalea subterranea]
MTRRVLRAARACAGGALVAVLLVACSAGGDPVPTPTPSATPTQTPEPTPEPEPWLSVLATATGPTVDLYAEPDPAVAVPVPVRTLAAAEVVSRPDAVPLTLLVIEQRDGWLHVALPVAPHGSTGWVRAADVTLSSTDLRLEVRLTEHRLLLHRRDEVVLDVAVGVNPQAAPAPGTGYFVTELLQPPTPDGVYGAYAYGLSGAPPVLSAFAAGAGLVALHGTSQPETVGTDTPTGSIRMLDTDVTRLVQEFGLPLGTPVDVVA